MTDSAPGPAGIWKGDVDYELPEELIAQRPAERRDASRLMVLDRSSGTIVDRRFADIGEFLRAGDLLVANDSKVFPARIAATKESGGRVELLLLECGDARRATAMCRSSKPLREGQRLSLADGSKVEVADAPGGGRVVLDFHDRSVGEAVHRVGAVPLPPYIGRTDPDADDLDRYQTVYADAEGSVAAPTAGLHFTQPLIEALGQNGVDFETVTLHVGPGTFVPIRGSVDEHEMETERYELSESAIERLATCSGRRIAVGTTTVRALESAFEHGPPEAGPAWTRLFITPGHRFKAVDGLVTNFHLPGSTLLCLVQAFAGRDLLREAYARAVAERYRFYSYGDAMLIL